MNHDRPLNYTLLDMLDGMLTGVETYHLVNGIEWGDEFIRTRLQIVLKIVRNGSDFMSTNVLMGYTHCTKLGIGTGINHLK